MTGTHGCNLTWCEQGNGPNESHWCCLGYTPATMNRVRPDAVSISGYTFPSIGTGVRWDEKTGAPAVYIHLSGGERDIDEDVYLRIDEAEALLDKLREAVLLVRETLGGEHRKAAQ